MSVDPKNKIACLLWVQSHLVDERLDTEDHAAIVEAMLADESSCIGGVVTDTGMGLASRLFVETLAHKKPKAAPIDKHAVVCAHIREQLGSLNVGTAQVEDLASRILRGPEPCFSGEKFRDHIATLSAYAMANDPALSYLFAGNPPDTQSQKDEKRIQQEALLYNLPASEFHALPAEKRLALINAETIKEETASRDVARKNHERNVLDALNKRHGESWMQLSPEKRLPLYEAASYAIKAGRKYE